MKVARMVWTYTKSDRIVRDGNASITITDDGSIIEGSENGETIVVTLIDGRFVSTLNPTNWQISNLPVGVVVGTIVRDSNTKATITLSGNRTVDYDTDKTNLSVLCGYAEILGGNNQIPILATTGVTFTAIDPILTFSQPSYPVNDGNPGIQKKLFSFKASSSPYDSIATLEIHRAGGSHPTFANIKIFIDLNDDGIVDANEQLTSDGVGGTINNEGNIDIAYDQLGTVYAEFSLSGIKLTNSLMAHDIMIVGDMDNFAQLGVGEWYDASAYLAGDIFENLKVQGNIIQFNP